MQATKQKGSFYVDLMLPIKDMKAISTILLKKEII
jgi:hypothetical protein